MTLEEIYFIGQTISAVAILGSLVAIYWQQRKAHALATAESTREILEQTSRLFDDLLASPTGLESLEACCADYRNAPVRQKTEFAQWMLKHVMLAEQANFMLTDKLIDYNAHHKLITLPALYLGTPGGREYWKDSKVAFGETVVAAIDKNLRENPIPIEEAVKIMPHIGTKVLAALPKTEAPQ
ncbi:MAG: hypothetical protein AAFP79_01095 [Pseudomonadota bacterium]